MKEFKTSGLLFPISMEDTQILLSLVDQRHNHQATIIASQFEPAEWLDQIPVPVAAEAITDRLCSQAYKIVIEGKKSMRETISDCFSDCQGAEPLRS